MMFLADENIPLEVVKALKKEGIDIDTLSTSHLGLEDERVLKLALNEERVLITFDTDFGELVFRKRQESHGVILLRLHPQTISRVLNTIKQVLHLPVEFKGSFCVVEYERVRVVPMRSNELKSGQSL